jgi:Concanavalin A-like lectin/glucanases superfamily
MNKYSHSFGKGWTQGLQFSFLSALIALSLFSSVAQASSGEPPPNVDVTTVVGLVAAYNFDEGTGTTVTDVSGLGNTGTINGASWTSQGKFGNALNFDGISNWVTVNDADSLDLTSGMTLEAWIYPPATTGTWTTVIIKERPEIGNLVYGLFASSPSTLPLLDVSTDSVHELYGPSAVPLNVWTHLAATYDAVTGQSLYVNGFQVAHASTTGNMITSIGPLRIGGNSIFGEYFLGTIDDVRVYNRALNQTEIQSDMNTPVGTQGPCVLSPGYWLNHPAGWCMGSIQIGCATYTQIQAIAIMRHNSSQDKTYSLAQQLIAAKLNIACKNTNAGCIAAAITAADNWLCTHPVGSGVKANSSSWQAIITTYNTLVNYNSGTLCAPSCGIIQ